MNLSKKLHIKSSKDFLNKLRWTLLQSKPVIPLLITTIFLSCMLSFINVYNTLVSKSLIDCAISGKTNLVIKWLIIMALIMLLNMIVTPITSFINTHASTRLNQNIQKRIYAHLQHSDWLCESKFHSVGLLTRVTSDVNTISSMLLNTIPTIVTLLVTLIASFSTLIFLAPSIAICATIIGPFLLVISKLLSKRLKKIYKESQEIDIKYKSFMQETLQNIMIVKTFCMEKLNLTKLETLQKKQYSLAIKNTKLSSLTQFSVNLSSNLAYFAIFCWGALNISNGVSTYGTFTAMLQLYSKIQYPITSLGTLLPSLISSIAATERLMELENIPLESIPSTKDTINLTHPSIKLENIDFQYNKNNVILKNITLNINPGEIVALIGPSGEGKTTLIRLLLSLIQPTKGNIIISQCEHPDLINKNYRQLISYVPQGNTLFSGTIEENLRYGNFNASIDEINDALMKSCAFNFVDKLDNGLNTLLGEKGLGLSEGQSQRISIARAFLRKKPILILDEATSSLDALTEIEVLKSIKTLPNNPTCIIITHRPSALNICNRILQLSNGNLIELSKESILEIANELN